MLANCVVTSEARTNVQISSYSYRMTVMETWSTSLMSATISPNSFELTLYAMTYSKLTSDCGCIPSKTSRSVHAPLLILRHRRSLLDSQAKPPMTKVFSAQRVLITSFAYSFVTNASRSESLTHGASIAAILTIVSFPACSSKAARSYLAPWL